MRTYILVQIILTLRLLLESSVIKLYIESINVLMAALLDTASDAPSIFPTNQIHCDQSLAVRVDPIYCNGCWCDIKLVAVDIHK